MALCSISFLQIYMLRTAAAKQGIAIAISRAKTRSNTTAREFSENPVSYIQCKPLFSLPVVASFRSLSNRRQQTQLPGSQPSHTSIEEISKTIAKSPEIVVMEWPRIFTFLTRARRAIASIVKEFCRSSSIKGIAQTRFEIIVFLVVTEAELFLPKL